MKNTKPRYLRLLRIDDELYAFPEEFPLKDLGQVSKWGEYVQDFTHGQLRTRHLDENNCLTDKKINIKDNQPDLLTVDFRFSDDDSTPPLGAIAGFSDEQHPVIQNGIAWSNQLMAKNTGLVIGVSLTALLAAYPMPVAFSLHTNAPEETGKDMTSLMLIGSMLACSEELQNDKDPLIRSANMMYSLAGSSKNAVLQAVVRYRQILLKRIVLPKQHYQQIHLQPAAYTLLHDLERLFSEADDSKEEQERLDEYLSSHGLELLSHSGVIDCLDLRSLFMDKLVRPRKSRYKYWGYISIKDVQKEGQIWDFLNQAFHNADYADFDAVAKLVQSNADTENTTKLDNTSYAPTARVAATLFAILSEKISKGNTINKQTIGYRLGWSTNEVQGVGWQRAFKDTGLDHKIWIPSMMKCEKNIDTLWVELSRWYLKKFYTNIELPDDIKQFIEQPLRI